MSKARAAGILLHPTSLPSPYGIGDLGPGAYRFVDFLKASGQKIWQILPLGPVGYGESPYQSFSAFAGNPLLLSLELLVEEGLLKEEDVAVYPRLPDHQVDYDQVIPAKERLFRLAHQRFLKLINHQREYQTFIQRQGNWLDSYALFMALKKHFRGLPWYQWQPAVKISDEKQIAAYGQELAREIGYQKFLQYLFFQQWSKLKEYANRQGVVIMGDLPIFIAHDSCDAWSYPQLFQLDQEGQPIYVAGVPPDYFSATGQLWGNPHYDWEEMAADDYLWWRQRLQLTLELVDMIRIDHFRGFEAYWQVPGDAETAVDGKWVKGPGEHFFATLEKHLGTLPLIAEDLGLITPEVHQLRQQFNLPGMQVLHFLLEGGPVDTFLGLFAENTLVYTGTHDNDTTVGWYTKALADNHPAVAVLEKYFQISPSLSPQEVCWRMLELAMSSRAERVIIPLQDVLALGSEARLNLPGTVGGNWQWRVTENQLTPMVAQRLSRIAKSGGRISQIKNHFFS